MPKVFVHPAIRKRLNKFDGDQRKRIQKALLVIEKNPYENNMNIRKLVAKGKKFYRVRVGDIRIIYQIIDAEKRVVVTDIDFRGNVY